MYNLRNIIQKSSKQFGKVCLGLGVASIVQGSYFITRYRLNHGGAPHPISPSRGIVVLKNNDHRNTCKSNDNAEEEGSLLDLILDTNTKAARDVELRDGGMF